MDSEGEFFRVVCASIVHSFILFVGTYSIFSKMIDVWVLLGKFAQNFCPVVWSIGNAVNTAISLCN